MWNRIKTWLYPQSTFTPDLELLKNLIIDIAGDGDCVSMSAIVACIQVSHPDYTTQQIIDITNSLLKLGILLSDGISIIDPVMRPNTAEKIRNGQKCI